MTEYSVTPTGHKAPPDVDMFERFLLDEARLLDGRRFRDWMALFTEDGTYWVPSVPDQQSPFTCASLFYDDRQLMETRVARLEHANIHIQNPPSRTMHHIGRPLVDPAADGAHYKISSTLIMAESRDGHAPLLCRASDPFVTQRRRGPANLSKARRSRQLRFAVRGDGRADLRMVNSGGRADVRGRERRCSGAIRARRC